MSNAAETFIAKMKQKMYENNAEFVDNAKDMTISRASNDITEELDYIYDCGFDTGLNRALYDYSVLDQAKYRAGECEHLELDERYEFFLELRTDYLEAVQLIDEWVQFYKPERKV